MQDKPNEKGLIGDLGHLTEEGLALYSEAIYLKKTKMLPGVLLDHVMNCHTCRADVFALYELLEKNPDFAPTMRHPFFNERDNPSLLREPLADYQKKTFFRKKRPLQIAAVSILAISFAALLYSYLGAVREKAQIQKEIAGKIYSLPGNDAGMTGKYSDTLRIAENSRSRNAESGPGAANRVLNMQTLMDMHLRQADFTLLSPKKESVVHRGERLLVAWKSKHLNSVIFMIMDASGNSKIQRELRSKQLSFYADLPEGTYYYVIAEKGDILGAGRIKVLRD